MDFFFISKALELHIADRNYLRFSVTNWMYLVCAIKGVYQINERYIDGFAILPAFCVELRRSLYFHSGHYNIFTTALWRSSNTMYSLHKKCQKRCLASSIEQDIDEAITVAQPQYSTVQCSTVQYIRTLFIIY